MMKKIGLLLPLFFLLSCEKLSFDSTLKVETPFTVEGKSKVLNVPAGTHDAKFSIVGKNKLELKIGDSRDQKIKFTLPKDVFLPKYEGRLFVSSQESGQDFDLEGDVSTSIDSSPSVTESQSCSVKVGTRRVCRYEPGPIVCRVVNGREVCQSIPHEVCVWEDVYEYGYRSVTYHYQTSQTSLQLDFKVPGSDQVLANLEGRSRVKAARIDESIGPCRIHGHYPY